jgi:hypothetical protein
VKVIALLQTQTIKKVITPVITKPIVSLTYLFNECDHLGTRMLSRDYSCSGWVDYVGKWMKLRLSFRG